MSIANFLKERGYSGPVMDAINDTTYFYKRIPRTKHQWVVREFVLQLPNRPEYRAYQVEVTFETFQGVWVNNKFYGLNEEDLREKLSVLESQIYKSVEAMGGDPLNYRPCENED